MKLLRFILSCLMGMCWGSAIVNFFTNNNIGFGLGMFAIGCLFAFWWLALQIEISIEKLKGGQK